IRRTSSLSSGLPGTIARFPESASAVAPSRESSRSPACRSPSSGPWHLKQFPARIGRMTLPKPKASGVGRSAAKPLRSPVARKTTRQQLRRAENRRKAGDSSGVGIPSVYRRRVCLVQRQPAAHKPNNDLYLRGPVGTRSVREVRNRMRPSATASLPCLTLRPLRSILRRTEGSSVVEYALILALVAAGLITSAWLLGAAPSAAF